MSNQKFTSFELDQLKEVVNIGASYASTALSQLVEKRVLITVPNAIVGEMESNVKEITANIGENKVMTAVILKMLGDCSGVIAFVMPKESAFKLAKLMTKENHPEEILNEFDRSALKEVGNILCGATLSAFSKFLDLTLLHSVSEVATDLFGSIISTIMIEVGQETGMALAFKVNFKIEGEALESQLCLFTDSPSSDKMLKILKSKLGV